MSKQPGIPEEQLRACLQDKYELYPVTLEFLPKGTSLVAAQAGKYLF